MKTSKRIFYSLIISSLFVWTGFAQNNNQQDSTGLPGDHFSLEGALEIFRKAANPEDFEKLLNTQDNNVNNLDLNEDGEVDYIKVIDKMEKDVHILILQVPVSDKENQDIAVIELEKDGNESAVLQIVGDEDIYGEEIIIEPSEDADNKMNKKGPSIEMEDALVVNVYYWPSVRYIYSPIYHPWVSPWRWKSYPGWWSPWRPISWHVFHPFRTNYHGRYTIYPSHRIVHARRIYTPVRVSSVSVHRRHQSSVNNYRVNRTKTTVTAGRGNNKVSATKRTTTVKGPKGNVKASKSTTTVKRKRG